MIIEPTTPSPLNRDVDFQYLRPGVPIVDTLISPHAPTWPNTIANFFLWIWSCVRPLLFFLPAIEPPPLPRVDRAIRKVEKEHQKQNPITATAIQALIPGIISWWKQDPTIFAMFVANKGFNGAAFSIEKVAQTILPKGSPYLKKGASLALGGYVIWHLADHLGYPQGKLYLFSVSISILGVFVQAQAAAQQKNNYNHANAAG